MTEKAITAPFWEEKLLSDMSSTEWESLCDGCGKCCLMKLEDDDTGEVTATNIGCRLLDLNSGQCSNYRHRKAHVPDCAQLTPAKIETFSWLPTTCAYRLLAEGDPLPDWHPLITGDANSVHEAGVSVRGWTVSEREAGPMEHHLTTRML